MAGCRGCEHLDYVEDSNSDGHVNWNNSGLVCNARHGVQNLKSFPFTKKEMECFVPDEQTLEERRYEDLVKLVDNWPENDRLSNNEYKCLLNLLEYINRHEREPNVIIIDEMFYRDFRDFTNRTFFTKIPKMQILVKPRFGKTEFDMFWRFASYDNELTHYPQEKK